MKGLILILTNLGAFVFGGYVIWEVHAFLEENQRFLSAQSRKSKRQIRIAAETPAFFDAVAAALEHCADANPCMEFFLIIGEPQQLLGKLREDRVDIVLVSVACTERLRAEFASIHIPCAAGRSAAAGFGAAAGTWEQDCRICAVWNRAKPSKDRDRVLFVLENEPCGLC